MVISVDSVDSIPGGHNLLFVVLEGFVSSSVCSVFRDDEGAIGLVVGILSPQMLLPRVLYEVTGSSAS